ncbi:hypothetical protein QJQ45_000231 [Haematococcus lacustris]|nr:hypothetical protein QJQ45_000231 [Haematococcus lacustris]
MHDIQREEIQRKEQQVVEQQHQLQQQQADLHLREQQVAEQHQLQQQQQADMHLREQQVTEQQHQLQQQQADVLLRDREQQVMEQQYQLQQQQADVLLRERQVAEQQHQLQQQQQADRLLREKHVAEQQHQLQLQQQLNRLQQQLEAQSAGELQRQVQKQLAVQQHLLQQQHADLLLKQQHVEKQLQEAADQQGVSTNHPLPDHPTCSPLRPGSLRSPLFKRLRQDTTQAPMPRHHSVAHALRIPGLPYSAVNHPGLVVVSCDWSEKLTIHQDIACQGAYWKQRTMSVFVACAHYQDMAGNYREESVFVSADKCDQSRGCVPHAALWCSRVLETGHDIIGLSWELGYRYRGGLVLRQQRAYPEHGPDLSMD